MEAAPFGLVDDKRTGSLSRREQDVVRCVVDGLSNRDIAQLLKLSEHTVKNYLFRAFDKLGLSSRVEMILYAFSHGASGQTSSLTREPEGDSPKDDLKTFDWYRKAAERGFGIAQFILGQRYRDGYGVPQDKLSAYMWFLLAERTGNDIGKSVREAKEMLSPKMRIHQIAKAERRASEWSKAHQWGANLLPPSPPAPDKDAVPATRDPVENLGAKQHQRRGFVSVTRL